MDSFDSYAELVNFVRVVSEGSGVSHFIMHARKCLLKGLNPHKNRTVPPLRYEWVWALKRDFPHLTFSLNGGVLTLEEVAAALAIGSGSGSGSGSGEAGGDGPGGILGVMVGRAAYNMPWDALGEQGGRACFILHRVSSPRCAPYACPAKPSHWSRGCSECRPSHLWRRQQCRVQPPAGAT